MDFITVRETAVKWNLSKASAKTLRRRPHPRRASFRKIMDDSK